MKKFFKWLVGLFSSSTIVATVGNGNKTTVSQTNTTRVLLPLTEQQIREISRKAVNKVAENKIVSKAISDSKMKPPVAPVPPPSRFVSDDDSLARRFRKSNKSDDDPSIMTAIIMSDIYSSPSHSSGHDSNSSCDNGSSFGSCD